MVEGSLFNIIDLLLGAKTINLNFIWCEGCYKKSQITKKNLFLIFLIFLFRVITAPWTLRGSWSNQGFVLIRAVLLFRLSKKNGIFVLGVVFLLSQFLPIEIKVFNKNFLYSIEDIDFLSSNLKKYIHLQFLL